MLVSRAETDAYVDKAGRRFAATDSDLTYGVLGGSLFYAAKGLMPFAQAQAYARRLAFLTPVVLPQGVVDLARKMPPQDVPLVASTTSLLARADTHPALLQLMAQAAVELHGPPGWFNRAREYPNLAHGEVPVAREAERAIVNGPPLLQRYLPFWLANLADRMWLALLAIVAVLIPVARVLPPVYEFRIRRRVFRWSF